MKHSNWIDALMLPLTVAVLNAGWVWLWLLWTVRAAPPQVVARSFAPLLLGLLVLGGYAVTRSALRQANAGRVSFGPGAARAVVTASGVLLVVAAVWQTYSFAGPIELLRELVDWGQTIPPVILGLAACAFLWLQGIQLGSSARPRQTLERAFYGGIFALVLLFMLNQPQHLIAAPEALGVVLAFFAAGLTGLALVRVDYSRHAEIAASGARPAVNLYWLGTVASVVGAILLVGLLLANSLSPQTFDQLSNAIILIVDAVTIAIIILPASLGFLVAWLLAPFFQFLAKIISQINFRPLAPANLRPVGQQILEFFARHPALNFARRGLVLGLILSALALFFWWAVRQYIRRTPRDADETRENIATRELMLAQLKNFLNRHRRALNAGPAFLSLAGGHDDPRLIVRRAYQSMLEWALVLSLPARRAGQTPTAYAETLRQALPEGRMEFEILTGAYVQARYAAEAPSMDVARAAMSAIRQLRSLSDGHKPAGDGVSHIDT